MENDGARQLRNPVLIAAFEGWNDAGEAATAGIEHLESVWNAGSVASLDPDEYYDFQVNRPLVSVDDDGRRSIEWPTTRLSVVSIEEHGRDIVLLRGIEPNMRWRAFCAELLSVATDLGCEQVVTLGALLADVPHTRPVPVTVSASDSDQTESLGLEQSRYEGPTGIVGVFQDAAARAGLNAVSLWAAVPHYVAQSPCPKATMVLLQRVEDLLGLPVPMGDLAEQAEAWQHGVDELAEEDSDVAEYVRRLEEARDTVDLPEASGEHIAREFERYLRRRDS
ncbi:PAC2 family protein [Jiangella muralis]|uniref:PAC2 family protein n=1 Tax=Jiangella muralis TaxID=702383 RepID=UPI00069F267F|nr:PAC2 family protein [Jiangella muralis]